MVTYAFRSFSLFQSTHLLPSRLPGAPSNSKSMFAPQLRYITTPILLPSSTSYIYRPPYPPTHDNLHRPNTTRSTWYPSYPTTDICTAQVEANQGDDQTLYNDLHEINDTSTYRAHPLAFRTEGCFRPRQLLDGKEMDLRVRSTIVFQSTIGILSTG